MEHLNIHDIIEFISFDRLDEETIALSGWVNAHMVDCAECRKLVRNMQRVYNGMLAESRRAEKAGAAESKPRSRPLEM